MKRMLSTKSGKQFLITFCAVVAAFVVMQAIAMAGAMSSMLKGQLVPICAYVVMAISLNLTVGILGELSLGHAGFMSVGAFLGTTTAVALQGAVPSPTLRLLCALVVGAVFAGVVGFLGGIPVLRLNGDYLAIVTLAFGEIIKSIFNNLYLGLDSHGFHLSLLDNKLHMEPDGKLIIGGPMGIGGIQKIASFSVGFALIVVCLVIIFNLVNSRAGRAIMAIRDNRIAAESVGIPITKYKMMAFVTSAAMAGAAGALFALNFSTIVANKFDFNTSILVLVFVVLGGQGNIPGSLIAAAALTVLPEKLRSFADYRMLLYAVLLIAIMLGKNSAGARNFFARFRGGKEE